MKFIKIIGFTLFLSFTTSFAEWATIHESIVAFDERPGIFKANRPGYVRPIITQLGTVLNSNWIISSNVPQRFSFDAGMPLQLSLISETDRVYRSDQIPTIFGKETPPNSGLIVAGNETLNSLPLFSYPILQAGFGFYHTRLVLRGMWLPAVSELKSFSLLGIGLQYSFGHLFQYALPKGLQSFNVSLGFGYNSSFISYTPENYKGSLDLDVSTHVFELVLGYSPISMFELMVSLGYESAGMQSSGYLESLNNEAIQPTLFVKGNNGFRFAFDIAFSFGESYRPVIGIGAGSRTAIKTNVLYFGQAFGEEPTLEEIREKKRKNSEIKAQKRKQKEMETLAPESMDFSALEENNEVSEAPIQEEPETETLDSEEDF